MVAAQLSAALPIQEIDVYCPKCGEIRAVLFKAGKQSGQCMNRHRLQRPAALPPTRDRAHIFSRRKLVQGIGFFSGAVATAAVAETFAVPAILNGWEALGSWLNAGARDKKAQENFAMLFNLFDKNGNVTLSLGKNYESGLPHKNHISVGHAFLDVFHLQDADIESASELTMSADGDLILVGGAASTPLAGIALGYTGDRFRTKGHELNYRPLIRLPYFTQYDSRRLGNDYVGWLIDDKGVRTHNWTIVAAQDKSEFYRPRTHLRETIPVTVDVASVETRLLQEDYLLVTHLPNYVNPLFAEIVKKWDVPEWPRLTIFGGAHGLGTMAVELLMGKEGLTALERFEEAVGGAVAYQAIFRVGDIERDGGFHRANSVEFVKAASLPLSQVTESHYLSAHNRAMNLMFPERARQRSR